MAERRRSFHFRQPASWRVHPSSGRRASPAVLARRPDGARWGCREWRRRGAGSVRVRLPVACTGPPGSLATSALGLAARARPASARWQVPGWPFALAQWSAGSGRAEPALAWAYGWHAGRGRRSARERPAAVRDHAHTTGVPGRAGSAGRPFHVERVLDRENAARRGRGRGPRVGRCSGRPGGAVSALFGSRRAAARRQADRRPCGVRRGRSHTSRGGRPASTREVPPGAGSRPRARGLAGKRSTGVRGAQRRVPRPSAYGDLESHRVGL